MSFSIASTSSSFDDFTLPEENEKSGSLDGREVHDFTKIPFYKKQKFVKACLYLGSLALAGLAGYGLLGYAMRHQGPNPPLLATISLIFGMITPPTIAIAGCVYAYNYKGYDDPIARKAFRLELEEDKITLHQFIQEHGWNNIRSFGFFIPSDQEPLCSKELMAQKIMQATPSKSFWANQSKNYYFKGIAVEHIHVGNTMITISRPYHYYWQSKPILWEAINHKVFSSEQYKEIESTFETRFFQAPACDLLSNWRFIKECGFNSNPRLQKLYDWLEKNEMRYAEIEKAYQIRAMRCFSKMGVYHEFMIHEKAPEPSEEFMKSLPLFNDGWLTGPVDHIQNLNRLNAWLEERRAEIEEEFVAEFS